MITSNSRRISRCAYCQAGRLSEENWAQFRSLSSSVVAPAYSFTKRAKVVSDASSETGRLGYDLPCTSRRQNADCTQDSSHSLNGYGRDLDSSRDQYSAGQLYDGADCLGVSRGGLRNCRAGDSSIYL